MKIYPEEEQKRVKLIRMEDPYTKLVDGDEGTIVGEDDAGHILVRWDRGSSLSLIPDVDEYEILEKKTVRLNMKYLLLFEKFESFDRQSMLDEFQDNDDMNIGCGCCSECTGEFDCNCCSECVCDDADLAHEVHFDLLDERAKAQRYKGKKIPGKYLTKNPSKMKKEIDTYRGKKEYKKDWDADYKSGKGGVGKRVKTKKSAATKAYQRMFGGKEK